MTMHFPARRTHLLLPVVILFVSMVLMCARRCVIVMYHDNDEGSRRKRRIKSMAMRSHEMIIMIYSFFLQAGLFVQR
jgi:hypothetical protein